MPKTWPRYVPECLVSFSSALTSVKYRQTAGSVPGAAPNNGPVIRHAAFDFDEVSEEEEDLGDLQELHI